MHPAASLPLASCSEQSIRQSKIQLFLLVYSFLNSFSFRKHLEKVKDEEEWAAISVSKNLTRETKLPELLRKKKPGDLEQELEVRNSIHPPNHTRPEINPHHMDLIATLGPAPCACSCTQGLLASG